MGHVLLRIDLKIVRWRIYNSRSMVKNSSRPISFKASGLGKTSRPSFSEASPNRTRSLPHLGRAFTDVQEQKQATWSIQSTSCCPKKMLVFFGSKQLPMDIFESPVLILSGLEVAAGTHFIQRSLESFKIENSKTTLMVDMYGYDSWPSLACLQDS